MKTSTTKAKAEVASQLEISAREYQKLLVSHRRLIRADQPHHGLIGLKDLDTGEWFLTQARRLFQPAK